MKLTIKFNIALIVSMTIGATIAGIFANTLLQNNAREEVLEEARIMMQSAVAVRKYTVAEIKPLLAMQQQRSFIKQTVPAYAARQYIAKVRKKYPDYNYKEATLNPTNPSDRATDWETDVINHFRGHDDAIEMVGERDTPTGRMLYLGIPIKITNVACLACHSTPDAAPSTMIKAYGSANGFGWQHNETVGAQIVSIPMHLPLDRAQNTFITFMTSLISVFVGIIVLINVMLHYLVIKPVTALADKANEVSLGALQSEELTIKGNDEISSLGHSFNRMHRSLTNAVALLEEED
jgi:HAMP domain-containing protein